MPQMNQMALPSEEKEALRRRLRAAVGNLEIAQKNVALLRQMYADAISQFQIGDIIEWEAGKSGTLKGAIEGIRYYDMESPAWIVRWVKKTGEPSERVTEVHAHQSPKKAASEMEGMI